MYGTVSNLVKGVKAREMTIELLSSIVSSVRVEGFYHYLNCSIRETQVRIISDFIGVTTREDNLRTQRGYDLERGFVLNQVSRESE